MALKGFDDSEITANDSASAPLAIDWADIERTVVGFSSCRCP